MTQLPVNLSPKNNCAVNPGCKQAACAHMYCRILRSHLHLHEVAHPYYTEAPRNNLSNLKTQLLCQQNSQFQVSVLAPLRSVETLDANRPYVQHHMYNSTGRAFLVVKELYLLT
jgi:hypothetical protein